MIIIIIVYFICELLVVKFMKGLLSTFDILSDTHYVLRVLLGSENYVCFLSYDNTSF